MMYVYSHAGLYLKIKRKIKIK